MQQVTSADVPTGKRDRVLRDWDEHVRQLDEERRASGSPEITEEEIAQAIAEARAERRQL